MAQLFTATELIAYNGTDAEKPVYIAVKGVVYDVSASRDFYGQGGPYEAFAGRECSRALAMMKVDPAECNDDLGDCSEKQLKTLEDWITKFNTKYPVVGKLPAIGNADEVDMSLLLRTSPFPPSMVATLLVVFLMTLVGAYFLYLDHLGPLSPSAHSEL